MKIEIRSAYITTKCPLISAAARIGLSRTTPPIRLKRPITFCFRSTICCICHGYRFRRSINMHHRDVRLASFQHLGHPQPLARILAQGHANRIRALCHRRGARRGPSNPVPAASGLTEARSFELSIDCESSTVPGPGQGCQRSAPPVPPQAAPIGWALAGACALPASPVNPTQPQRYSPDQPHHPHHFSACSLRGLYRLRLYCLPRLKLSVHPARSYEETQHRRASSFCATPQHSMSALWFRLRFRIHLLLHHRSVRHVLEHIVREEELPVRRHHHHLDLV